VRGFGRPRVVNHPGRLSRNTDADGVIHYTRSPKAAH